MYKYLVETALISHGLISISNEQLLQEWRYPQAPLVWLEQGQPVIGTLTEYLPLREKAEQLRRIDSFSLQEAQQKQYCGALTASATMEICQQLAIPIAVTCGMGGVGPIPEQIAGADLLTLSQYPLTLIAAAPKDVFDLPATIEWLRQHGVKIIGVDNNFCTGFLTQSTAIELDAYTKNELPIPPLLLLNGLKKRPVNEQKLQQAMNYGTEEQKHGRYYHPAVNQKLDEITQGLSSHEQLAGLIANIALAESL